MPRDDLKKWADAGFIPGIYNYCDRWCEKCTQQSKCLNYVMGKRIAEKGEICVGGSIVRDHKNIGNFLKNVFDSTYEILQSMAEEYGVDIDNIYETEFPKGRGRNIRGKEADEEKTQIEKAIENSDILKVCAIYEELADACLEYTFTLLDEKAWADDSVEAKECEDALQVVNWYLDMLEFKLRRALASFHSLWSTWKSVPLDNDYNGSAKIALMGIDASMKEWKVLREKCPEENKNISHILVVLGQLLRDIEKQFPDARSFIRPGFDQ